MFYTVLSTKGGVGKTTIAQQVLAPAIYDKTKEIVEVIELDNNNKSDVLESKIETIKTYRLVESEDVLLEKFMDVIADEKDVVIDVGGGDDTKKILKAYEKLALQDEVKFFIPVLRDLSNEKNVIDTYALIRNWNLEAKIYFIKNKSQSEDDFNEIISKIEKVEDENIKFLKLDETKLFDAVSKEFKQTVYELALLKVSDEEKRKSLQEAAKTRDKQKLRETKRLLDLYFECSVFKKSNLEPIFKEI